MIVTFLNLVLAVVGSLALALAVFVLINQPFQCMWSRHWLRQRLGISHVSRAVQPPPSISHTMIQNLSHDAVMNEEMANLLDAVAREIHLGRSLTAAFLHTYRAFPLLADHVQPIAQSCERNVSLTEALRASGSTSQSAGIPTSVVFGMRALWAATTGGTGALALERAASTLRERTAIQYERRAQSAQARLSVRILTWLPVVFLGVQFTTNPQARWFLLASPVGWAFLLGGLGLNWYGRRWMNRVVRGTTS